ncbi:MAG: hypothetical protein IPO92_09095 [Saprospiraceae bacterium]|nr:hypothetical protein [Saprospiraceae bacterium]
MFGNKKEDLRKEKFHDICALLNMTYLGIDEFGVKASLVYFEHFNKFTGKIRNLCQSKSPSLETEINLFDYTYTISTGKTFHTFEQTVMFINSKKLGLPEFRMKPETIGSKIASYFGWDDINFEEYPSFSEKYKLTGDEEEFIRHTFDNKVLKFFSKTSGWTIEAANYYLIFYAHNVLVPENILIDFYRVGMGVFDLFSEDNEAVN